MKTTNIRQMMARTVIEKKIRGIKSNSDGAAAGLASLIGSMKIPPEHKVLAETVKKELENKNSAYSQLAERFIASTGLEQLNTLCQNLALNCVSDGAARMTDIYEKTGLAVPVSAVFDMSFGKFPPLSQTSNIISQCKELGIYLYILDIGKTASAYNLLPELCQKHPDCVFVLLTDSAALSENSIKLISPCKNTVVLINSEKVTPQAEGVLRLLSKTGCAAGGFARYESGAAASRLTELTRPALDLGVPVLCLVQNGRLSVRSSVGQAVSAMRTTLKTPLFPSDLYGDIYALSKSLMPNARLLTVSGGDQFIVSDMDNGESCGGISLSTPVRRCLDLG